MIDLGVACLNSTGYSSEITKCVICNELNGWFMFEGENYCDCHSKAGAVNGYVEYFDNCNVVKYIIGKCKNSHRYIIRDNVERPCWCGEKLNYTQ